MGIFSSTSAPKTASRIGNRLYGKTNFPSGNNMFKVNKEILEQGVEYV